MLCAAVPTIAVLGIASIILRHLWHRRLARGLLSAPQKAPRSSRAAALLVVLSRGQPFLEQSVVLVPQAKNVPCREAKA
jgi:hypothetical protein